MSSKTMSPTAQLLRSSKFFSLPRPLAAAAHDMMGTRMDLIPDASTAPYPTQQAIVTTPKARARGDWGLKRTLPTATTTRVANPVYRLNAMDTWEHITDYSPAADLTLNLQKMQELNLSVTTATAKTRKSVRNQRFNVFEPHIDNTDPSQDALGKSRWKRKGPWVAGMSQGDFEEYVRLRISGRKEEFKQYLRAHARTQLQNERRAALRHEGRRAEQAADAPAASYEPTSEEIDGYVRRLRGNFTLISELSSLVERFLDLPSAPMEKTDSVVAAFEYSDNRVLYEQGPPKTHPSAGIAYARTDAYLDMHPLFGPQRDRTPVEARVMSRLTDGFQSRFASGGKIGVAGVVSNEPVGRERIRSSSSSNTNDNLLEVEDRKSNGIGIATVGGNRIWVHPNALEVNSRGRVHIRSGHSNATNVGIMSGDLAAPSRSPAFSRRSDAGSFDTMPQWDSTSPSQSASAAAASGGRAAGKDTLLDFLRDGVTERNSRSSNLRRPSS